MSDIGSITRLKSIDAFRTAVDKLLLGKSLTNEEASLLLSAAILLLRYSFADSKRPRSLEFAYWIVLNYSLNTGDLKPLYDFSFELGLYPISKSIAEIDNRSFNALSDYIALAKVEDGFTEDVTLTLEQKLADDSFFSCSGEGFAYIAPTSFGKTRRLIKAVLDDNSGMRPCIIVPTKSLLAQTRDDIFRCNPRTKVITHDEMYQNEKEFIAVLTQERAIRLLEAHPALSFTSLFVDEAHNAFRADDRSLLISRLVRESKIRNPHAKFYFFSPVIDDISNLSSVSGFDVAGCKIGKSMKEPRYYHLDSEGTLRAYNRFFDSFCDCMSFKDAWDCLIGRATAKNLVFLSSPRNIREAALDFADNLPDIAVTLEVERVISALSEHVSPMYDEISCLRHGVVYLHGQMPDGIKNYLLDRAAKLDSIRFIFANSVIMEGMNLPFESVFILNLRTSRASTLVNLIGRASRLNFVFGEEPHLEKLRPQVIFADSQWMGAKVKMENAIKKMHSVGFKDCEENLRIKESKGETLKTEEKERLRFEDNLIRTSMQAEDDLGILLDRSGFRSIYGNWAVSKIEIERRLRTLEADSNDDILELICKFFIDGGPFVFAKKYGRVERLREQIDFYRNYLERKSSQSLSQRLASDIGFWKKKSGGKGGLLYVGSSFGELNYWGEADGNGGYVDLRRKTDSSLPALFLAKYKTEDDYLGFTLSRFVRVLYKTGHIDQNQYCMFIYGATDKRSVELIQAGVPLSLIKILEEQNLLDDIGLDAYGNIKIGNRLQSFSKKVDDYTGFEIGQFDIE